LLEGLNILGSSPGEPNEAFSVVVCCLSLSGLVINEQSLVEATAFMKLKWC